MTDDEWDEYVDPIVKKHKMHHDFWSYEDAEVIVNDLPKEVIQNCLESKICWVRVFKRALENKLLEMELFND